MNLKFVRGGSHVSRRAGPIRKISYAKWNLALSPILLKRRFKLIQTVLARARYGIAQPGCSHKNVTAGTAVVSIRKG